jgi:hypothetical protein
MGQTLLHKIVRKQNVSQSQLLVLLFCLLLLFVSVFLLWKPGTSSVDTNKRAPPNYAVSMKTSKNIHETGVPSVSPKGFVMADPDLTKLSSVEELENKEEKIPWDWTKNVKLADEAAFASKKALEGDNRWAREMAKMSHPPYSNQMDMANKGKFGVPFPPRVSNNRLDWYKLAAERNDPKSQVAYWSGVDAISRYADLEKVPKNELVELQANARRYLQVAMDNGVADAYSYAAEAYRDGKMGLQQSAIKAHACLIILERQYSTEETRQLLEYSAGRLRTGELSQAEVFANDPASCKIN